MSKTMRAVKTTADNVMTVSSCPVPSCPPAFVLVKVSHVALNPTDWKHVAFMPKTNSTVGCDFSGTITQIGSAVTKPFKVGQRVAGFSHGVKAGDDESGAFGESAKAVGDILARVPDDVSDADASTLGVGVTTVGQALYQSLGLPMPDKPSTASPKIQVLVYGGSTSTGQFAIQWAKLSGLDVLVTCSPHNFEKVKKLGASEAFDYSDPKCGEKIREYSGNGLKYAFDTISEGKSPKICCEALGSGEGGMYTSLLPVKDFPRDDVEHKMTLAYSVNGLAYSYRGKQMPASPEDFEFGKKLWSDCEQLMAEGKLTYPTILKEGGLEGVIKGLGELREGKVSGGKLVYKVQ